MKNSKKYAKKVQELYRRLKRKYPRVEKPTYDEPLDALVYAVVSENLSEAHTQQALKKFKGYFVDLNDLRVSRPEEIIEVLGENTQTTRTIAATLGKILRSVFERYNNVSLKPLKKMGKRAARDILEDMEGPTGFAVDYCALTALQSHAVPFTKTMVKYLRENELVHPDADEQQIRGFLARQIMAKNAYEFYVLLRQQSESPRPRAHPGKKGTAGKKKGEQTEKKKTTRKKQSKK